MQFVREVSVISFLIGIFCHPILAQDSHISLNNVFSGAPPTSTNNTWMDVVFQDVSPGTVRLTVSNLHLTGTENVDQLYLNLNPAFDPLKLHFTFVSASGGFDLPSISQGTNAFKAGGDGKYDIQFNFTSNSNDQGQFTQGEFFTYHVSGIGGLKAADFDYLSLPAGGAGPFYAAAHVQRIGDGSLSGWISGTDAQSLVAAPEPSAFAVLALGTCLCFAHSRRN